MTFLDGVVDFLDITDSINDGSKTVYTVPSGRFARVYIPYFLGNISFGTSGDNRLRITNGGQAFTVLLIDGPAVTASAYSDDGNGERLRSVSTVIFGAGDTVEIVGNSTNRTTTINLKVLEYNQP